MNRNNSISSKNNKRYNYKKTGQILKSNREVFINNTNNIKNRSDKKKQLIKTLIDKNQFEGVLTNCL